MFRKLVSNLSFSPGISTHLAFYARRLRGEDLTRKLSMIFGIGILAFQFVAMVTPTESVNANGPNNVLLRGFSSKSDLINQLRMKDPEHASARALFDHLHIGEAQINAARDTYIPARGSSRLSFGRHRMAASDKAVTVDRTGNTFYARPLGSIATTAKAHVLEGTTADGKYFAVLFTCGNPVVTSLPTPPAPAPAPAPISKTPALQLTKATIPGTPAANSNVRPGDQIGYRIYFSNTGNGDAGNTFVEDSIPRYTEFVKGSIGSGGATRYDYTNTPYPGHGQEPHVYWNYANFQAGATHYYVDFSVKVSSSTPNGTQICNTAFIRGNGAAQKESNKICHKVAVSAAKPPETPPSTTPPPTTVAPTPAPEPAPTTPAPAPTTPPITTPIVSPNIQLSKTAVYLKRDGQTPDRVINANGTTAGPGDVIEYTLKVLNSGSGAQENQPINDDIHDILEYADISNAGGGTLAGGTISWGTAAIPANTTINKVFQVTVKTPIPATPRSGSDIYSYDLSMDNLFNNKVSIKVEAPTVAKQVETTAQQLPATGAETNIFVAFFVAALLIYFYSRNRQLIHETAILTVDHNPGV